MAMASDELSLISSAGPAVEDLREMNAYLGISFSMSKYFSRSRMKQYFEWAGQNLRDLEVIVADHFEGYNFNVFKGIPLETAFDRAHQVGIQFATNYRRAIPPSLTSRIHIVLASELLQRPKCVEIFAFSRELAAKDLEFKGDVESAILELLSGKLEDAGYHGENLKPALEILQQYIFEEIAIILYSAHLAVPTYPVAIFPYPPREVITKIYENHYGGAFRQFTRGQPFRFVQVAPSGFEVLKSQRNESYYEALHEADLLEPR
jgi:tRNA-dependent cyclodipeptide synthase